MGLATSEEISKNLWQNQAATMGFLVNTIVKKFGDEGRKAIIEAARNAGFFLASTYVKQQKIKERGTRDFAQYISSGSDFKLETIELTNKKWFIKVTYCPLLETWKAMGALPEICDLICKADEGMAKAFNPKLSLTLQKTMCKGDPYCLYIFEERED